MIALGAFSQENSPYSRYGLGDLVPSASITSRSMGGIAAGMSDYDKRYDLKFQYPKSQTINFLIPPPIQKQELPPSISLLKPTIEFWLYLTQAKSLNLPTL